MYLQLLTMLKDQANIILWVILAAVALVLVIVCLVLSFVGKKSQNQEGNAKKTDDDQK